MERRYQDHEIREILDLAIGGDEAPARASVEADGLTLRELQEVGREVGVPPDRITHAVKAFEGREALVPRGTMLGLPTTVGTIVALPRSPSDREWELLVSELRTTFGGKGEVTSQGGLREWSYGTVQAFIEPTETGYRLRLVDSRVAAMGAIAIGGFFLAFALLILVVLLGKEDAGAKFAVPVFFSLIGGGMIGGTVMTLPKWARDQEKRLEYICGHALELLDSPARPDPPTREHHG